MPVAESSSALRATCGSGCLRPTAAPPKGGFVLGISPFRRRWSFGSSGHDREDGGTGSRVVEGDERYLGKAQDVAGDEPAPAAGVGFELELAPFHDHDRVTPVRRPIRLD